MEQETMNITYPAKDVESIIQTYFGDALQNLEITMIGRVATAYITYEDFKPKRQVRRELEAKIPNLEIDELQRVFSNRVKLCIIDEMCCRDDTLYIKESNGALRETKLCLIVEELSYFRSFQN